MPATHEIPLDRATIHGHFSTDLPPVVTVEPGDSVSFQALNAGWRWDAGGRWLDGLHPVLDDGHPLTGPIAVQLRGGWRDAGGSDRRGAAARLGRLPRRRERAPPGV